MPSAHFPVNTFRRIYLIFPDNCEHFAEGNVSRFTQFQIGGYLGRFQHFRLTPRVNRHLCLCGPSTSAGHSARRGAAGLRSEGVANRRGPCQMALPRAGSNQPASGQTCPRLQPPLPLRAHPNRHPLPLLFSPFCPSLCPGTVFLLKSLARSSSHFPKLLRQVWFLRALYKAEDHTHVLQRGC